MRLSFLDLKGFRSFKGEQMELGAPRVLFAGLNGTGKTTVRDAIQWTLLGIAPAPMPKGLARKC